jgi:hypothetical protein
LHDAVTSDGTSFTVVVNQTSSDTQPNVAISNYPRSTFSSGVCATTFFKSVVGNQATLPLGNPAADCL